MAAEGLVRGEGLVADGAFVVEFGGERRGVVVGESGFCGGGDGSGSGSRRAAASEHDETESEILLLGAGRVLVHPGTLRALSLCPRRV